MDMNQLMKDLCKCKESNDDQQVELYLDHYVKMLDECDPSVDLISLAVKTVSIDQGANFLDWFVKLDHVCKVC